MAKQPDENVAAEKPPQPPHLEFETERAQFHSLLLANPNYFGNLPESVFKPVKPIAANVFYEELTCVGYNPNLNELEATIQIKRASGYGSDLCGPGSTEYVRFFVDYGSGWTEVGLAGVNVHSIPTALDCTDHSTKPLSYVVSVPIEPKTDYCGNPVEPNVRAVLQWNTPPSTNPGTPPIWGNALDRHILFDPRPIISLGQFVDVLAKDLGQEIKLPPQFESAKFEPIPLPDPPPLELAQLAKLYSAPTTPGAKAAAASTFSVEAHRFGTASIHQALASTTDQQQVVLSKAAEFAAVGVDWQSVVGAWQQTNGNTTYEQLDCLGLDHNREWLGATFVIKKSNGYSGDLCSHGSTEFVAFWADWDNTCTWTYLGTVPVQVHDIAKIPADGLHYTALLPVNLDPHRLPCEQPKIGRVRAVLSWAVPPSTVDPNALPYWGNAVETHVHIKPGQVGGLPVLRAIGGINIEDINTGPFDDGMTKPTAQFWYYQTPADGWGLNRECPFGGAIWFEGKYAPGYKYRLSVHKEGDPPNTWTWVTNSLCVRRVLPGCDLQVADVNGFFTYLDPATHLDSRLTYWASGGDDLWTVRYEVANLADVVLSTSTYRIQLDNTAPTAEPLLIPPTIAIHIDGLFDGTTCQPVAAVSDCADIVQGAVICGRFVARDIHFGGFSLSTEPNTVAIPSNSPTTATVATTQTAPFPGDEWRLNTGSPIQMKPCGYVVRVDASDRTIVGSQPGSHNYNHIETGFCLRAQA